MITDNGRCEVFGHPFCLEVDSSGNCENCMIGSSFDGSGGCIDCSSLNCYSCTNTTDLECSSCYTNMQLEGTECVFNNCEDFTIGAYSGVATCNTPSVGYRIEEGVPVACPSNCDTCDSTGCLTCADPYTLQPGNSCWYDPIP